MRARSSNGKGAIHVQEQAIFIEALDKESAAERAAYLDQACEGDSSLRRRIEKLLQRHEQEQSFLQAPAAMAVTTLCESPGEGPGTVIGPYKLLEKIGEGGFGVVFMAEQQQPVRRKVALKILKAGMDTGQIIARFEAESQALALMDHPSIARVFDGGQTRSARPYFVMELVKGIPITDYCDQNQLTTRERLQMFIPLCQAVQHAHQKGVIHRDLKPSNVLVTLHDGTPFVKVIDFGIAKATGQQLTEKTLFTNFAQLIGTPLYMSPEQAAMSGLDVDTRSDIYSLGVLLYELLTGTTPFERQRFKQADYDEILRIIREEEPPKPSARVTTLGRAATTLSMQRKADSRQLSRLFRGELDWIVMKCLEKDRNRRYVTANSLALDVDRYLRDEPVEACPPSTLYRLRKFARRHKVALLIAASTALGVVLAILALAVSNARIDNARRNEKATKEQLQIQLYYQTVGLVERERSAGNAGRAEDLLDAPQCRPDLRGWEWHYLKRLRYGGLAPVPYPCFLWSLAVSRDGRWLAVGGMDGIIRLWDVKTWKEVRWFQAHGSWVKALAFSPDSSRLASGSWSEGSVNVWSIPAGEPITSLARGDGCTAVAFSPDGRRLVSAGTPGIKVWDAATWQELSAPETGEGEILSIAFSPDGRRLGAGGAEGTVRVWDLATWREVYTPLAPHLGEVLAVAFSPDGTLITSATGHYFYSGDECAIQIWDAASGQMLRALRGHQGAVFSVAFSPDGKRLATTGGEDPTIKIWDATNWLEAITLRGHDDSPWGVAFSPDGRVLYSAGADHTLRRWDGSPIVDESGPALRTLTGHTDRVAAVAFNPVSHRLVSAGVDRTIREWDVTTGRPLHWSNPQPGLIQSVAISPDGHLLASASYGEDGKDTGLLKIWDCHTWQELYGLSLDPEGFVGAAFTPDGRRLVTAGAEGSLVVWETSSFHASPVSYTHVAHLTSVAVSPDGRRAASADVNGEVRIWDLEDGRPALSVLSSPPLPCALVNLHAALMARPLYVLRAHTSRVTGVAFSPKRDLLATCGMDGATCLWDARTLHFVDRLHGHDSGVRCLAFSPDGTRLATGGNDATIQIWDVGTRLQLISLHGHADVVYSLTFSHDGQYIASGSKDQTAKIWRAKENLR
jgi:WD40 repeat protein/serine/threonine protein kinase